MACKRNGCTPEEDNLSSIFGTDPWMRFDIWASRAWEASQGAIDVAKSASSVGMEDNLDQSVIAMFHAANIAKEIAEMASPASVAIGERIANQLSGRDLDEITLSIPIDNDE